METLFQEVSHSAGPSQGCSGDPRSPQNVLVNPDSAFQQRTLISVLSDTKSTGLPGGSAVKNPPANGGDARDAGSIPGSGRSPGERNGNPLQYSCLKNPMDRGARQAPAHGVGKSRTQLGTHTHIRAQTWCLILLIKREVINYVLVSSHVTWPS